MRLIVFDLDGTLVDSRRDLAESANAVLAAFGRSPLPEEAIGRMVGDGAATLVSRAFAAANCPKPPDALERFLAVYNARLLQSTRPYPGVEDVLADLSPRFQLAVLTNKPLAPTRQILEGLDLARHFSPERVLGGDGPLPRKPDPAGLYSLIRDADTSAGEAMLVGDSPIDIRTARNAGSRLCLARYGFGYEGVALHDIGAKDAVIDNPLELLTILL